MNIKEKKIIVTGGGGFFGSHIYDELKNNKFNNIYVPRTKKGYDFRDFNNVYKYFQKIKPDIIINCASHQGGIGYQQKYPATVYYDNLLMGAHTMEAARIIGIDKYVNIIAACSYPGEYNQENMSEDIYWNGPLHPSVANYGITKKVQLIQSNSYKRQYNFNSINLLFTNMYGPKDHFEPSRSHALAAILKKTHESKMNNHPSITMWGTGKPIREWLYVRDAAKAVRLALTKVNNDDLINIGTGKGCTIIDLTKMIKNVVGYEGEIKRDLTKMDGAMKKVLDISRMKKVLKWIPEIELKKGIQLTYSWYLDNIG